MYKVFLKDSGSSMLNVGWHYPSFSWPTPALDHGATAVGVSWNLFTAREILNNLTSKCDFLMGVREEE